MARFKNLAVFVVSILATCVLSTAEVGFSSDLASVVDRATSGNDIDWDYSEGPNGPAHWGELSSEWKQCSEGTWQSPIDVDEEHIQLDRFVDTPAKLYYRPAPAFVHGDGKSLEVQWAGGIFNLHDWDYLLEKLVFHSPSEHTYSGERFPLEVQFYHTHPTEGVAINVIVYREGEKNKWLEQITPGLPTSKDIGKTVSLGIINAEGVEYDALDWNRYYRYLGSLTVPPCSQTPYVYWSMLKAPQTASKEQIEQVAAALKNTPNVRPIQPLGDRRILFPRHSADDSN